MTMYSLNNRRQPTLYRTYPIGDRVKLREKYTYPLYAFKLNRDELVFIINDKFYDHELHLIEKLEWELYLEDINNIPKHYMSKLLQLYLDTNK